MCFASPRHMHYLGGACWSSPVNASQRHGVCGVARKTGSPSRLLAPQVVPVSQTWGLVNASHHAVKPGRPPGRSTCSTCMVCCCTAPHLPYIHVCCYYSQRWWWWWWLEGCVPVPSECYRGCHPGVLDVALRGMQGAVAHTTPAGRTTPYICSISALYSPYSGARHTLQVPL